MTPRSVTVVAGVHQPCLLMFCITVVYVVNVIAAPGMPRNSATGKPRHKRPMPSAATSWRAVERKVGEEAMVGSGAAAAAGGAVAT